MGREPEDSNAKDDAAPVDPNLAVLVHNSSETLARAKRIETKVSRLMDRLGYEEDAGTLPKWEEGGVVSIPSMEVSFKKILEAIPKSWTMQVQIIHNRQVITTIQPAHHALRPRR